MDYASKFYRTILDTFSRVGKFKASVHSARLDFSNDISKNKKFIDEQAPFFSNVDAYTHLEKELSNLETAINKYNTALANVDEFLEINHRKLEVSLMQTDYQMHKKHTLHEDNIRELQDELDIRRIGTGTDANQDLKEVREYIHSLKNNNSNWLYAGADINPTDPAFTATAVGNDPLYIVATDELQKLVKKEFNKFYGNRRLRCYTELDDLPDNGFGSIYCFGKYEFMPLDPLKDELKIVLKKLMPGGELFFSYNNCDHQKSLNLCGYRAYQTEGLIGSIAYGLGFDKVCSQSFYDHTHSIMTVRKPGTLVSQKKTTISIDIQKTIDNNIDSTPI